MSKPRVAILTCHNTKQDLYCSSYMCLHDLRETKAGFAGYREMGGADLVGIVTCDGCPTLAAPQRILKRVAGVVDLGVDAIHISSCMLCACPYRNKYMALLHEAFPQVKIVPGTHYDETVEPEVGARMFQQIVGPMLAASPERTMADVARMLYPDEFAPRPAACVPPPVPPGPAVPAHLQDGGRQ